MPGPYCFAAGYLCFGSPDKTALLLSIFFYPWTLAHLGVNDLVDIENDKARGMKSVTVLYGTEGTAHWILLFTIVHFLAAPLVLMELGSIALIGFMVGFILLGMANYKIMKEKSSVAALTALPIFHLTMAIYVSSIILDCVF